MTAIAEINETLIRTHISRAVSDVFQTMLGRAPTLVAQITRSPDEAPVTAETHKPQVVGTVGFVGEINGLIYLHLDLSFARICTCHLLGMTDAELEEAGEDTINDAIGELTNMTVGGFKNGLCDAGYPCKLTIPSIVRGSNFVIEPITAAARHTFEFDCQGHRVVADILIQKDE